MKKKIITVAFVAALGVFAGYTAYNAQKSEAMSDIALANVEALAVPEQPDVNDCSYDPEITCVALHPTDPLKDKSKPKAKW